jgi:hypothetical protein
VNNMIMELETFEIASTLHLRCLGGLRLLAGAEMRVGKDDKVALLQPGTAYKNKVNATDFSVNHSLLLGFQLSGSGRMETKIIPGRLNLAYNPMVARITPMQQELGLAILQGGTTKTKGTRERRRAAQVANLYSQASTK